MQEKSNLRILIIAPGSMSRQWFSEIYLRFGARAFGLIEAQTLLKTGERRARFCTPAVSGGTGYLFLLFGVHDLPSDFCQA